MELSARATEVLGQGFDVFLTVHPELYKISSLISSFTKEQVRFVIGISVLVKVLAGGYAELYGHVLEGLSRLFTKDVRVYVYPMALEVLRTKLALERFADWKISDTDGLLEADGIVPPPPLGHLYSYLLASGLIEPLRLLKTKTRKESIFQGECSEDPVNCPEAGQAA